MWPQTLTAQAYFGNLGLRQRTQPGITLGICRPAAVAQVVQHRAANHEILGSNPGTAWQLDAASPALLIIL